eukprot:TRINITY_DN8633_c0_g1_i1.p1 TRINITY_DN8633_c0_g1~~TRINITY_DN8633_c0_g1_i1.p1  ORF type:complete len:176 (+),score=29.54 TRINITY_DN8633_c0_g1_i1:64-591(+)
MSETGWIFAVKTATVAARDPTKDRKIEKIQKEIWLMKKLVHPNIVRYYGSIIKDCRADIFMEYISGGTISQMYKKFGAFRLSVIREYTRQILSGLEYIHKNDILHRDLKGANILVDSIGTIKLADFGASKQFEGDSLCNTVTGTQYWMAPDILHHRGDATYGRRADIWSVGSRLV